MMKKIFLNLIFLVFFSSFVKADISTSLIAYFDFNENTIDKKTNIDLQIRANGKKTYDMGKFAQAYKFDKNMDNSLIANNLPFSGNVGTISFWFDSNSSLGKQVLFAMDDGDSNSDLLIELENSNLNYGNAMDYDTKSSAFTINTWQHLTITFSDTNSAKLYLNGVLQNAQIDNNESMFLQDTLFLGNLQNDCCIFDGLIDELRIYDRELSASDVNELYNFIPPKEIFLENHGGVLQFDGNNSYVDITYNPSLQPDSNISIEMKIFLSSLATPSEDKHFISNADSSNYHMGINTNGEIFGSIFTTSYQYAKTSLSDLNIGWNHIAMTYDGSKLKLIINGIEKNSSVVSGNIKTDTSINLYLGAENTGNNASNFFTGALDEVRIWNVVRSIEQINEFKDKQINANESALVAYYNFDERVGSKIYDLSANANHGVLKNVQRLNFLGDVLEFNQSDSYITLGTDTISNKKQFSAAAWVNLKDKIGIKTVISKNNEFELSLKDGKIRGVISELGLYSDWCDSDEVLELNKWYHIAYTHDDLKDEISLFLNGEKVKTCSNKIKTMGTNNSSKLYIARYEDGSTSDIQGVFSGQIAQVSLWDKVLSSYELKKIMSGPLKGDEDKVISYFPLNEGKGLNIFDNIANKNGIITNTSWIKNSPKTYGDFVYTSQDIKVINKIKLTNFTANPSYTKSPNDKVMLLNDKLSFLSSEEGISSVILDSGSPDNISKNISFKTYENTQSSISLNFLNHDSSKYNISNISFLDLGTGVQINLEDTGENKWKAFINTAGTYLAQITTNDNQIWFVNFSDKKVYLNNDGSNDFKIPLSLSESKSYDIDSSFAWQNRPPNLNIEPLKDFGNNLSNGIINHISAVQSGEKIYVAYMDSDNKAYVKYSTGLSWNSLARDSAFDIIQIKSLDMSADENGNIYIAMINNNDNAIIRKFDGNSWQDLYNSSDFTGEQIHDLTIDVNSLGVPYIGYSDWADGRKALVKYYNGNAWVKLPEIGSLGQTEFNRLKIDNNDNIHVAFWDEGTSPTNRLAIVKKFDGNTWLSLTDDNKGYASTNQAYSIDLQFDKNNIPYVFVANNGSKFEVRKFESNIWKSVGGSNWTDIDKTTSLAFDKDNIPHVLYNDLNVNTYNDKVVLLKYMANNWLPVLNQGNITDGNIGDVTKGIKAELLIDSNNDIYTFYSDSLNAGKLAIKKISPDSSILNVHVNENTLNVMDLNVSDADNDIITYQISGGGDKDSFVISPSGMLSFKSAPDFETPKDNNFNNIYIVDVSISDTKDTKTIKIKVKIVDELESDPIDILNETWNHAKYNQKYTNSTVSNNPPIMQANKNSVGDSFVEIFKAFDEIVKKYEASVEVTLEEIDNNSFVYLKLSTKDNYSAQISVNANQAVASLFNPIGQELSHAFLYDFDSKEFFKNKKIFMNISLINGVVYFNILDENEKQIGRFIKLESLLFEAFNKLSVGGRIADSSSLSLMKFELHKADFTQEDNAPLLFDKSFSFMEKKSELSLDEYNNLNALDVNGTVWYQFEAGGYDSNGYFASKIGMINANEGDIKESSTLLDISNNILKNERFLASNISVDANNIISIKDENGIAVEELKYMGLEITSEDFLNKIRVLFPFSANASLHKLYSKRLINSCRVQYIENNKNYNNIDEMISSMKFNENKKFLNPIILNKRLKAINLFFSDTTDGELAEVILPEKSKNPNFVGTYEIKNDFICSYNGANINLDLIDIKTTMAGYDNIALGFKDGKKYILEYDKIDEIKEIYFLDKNALLELLNARSINHKAMKKVLIKDLYTYISLPSKMILCTQELKNYLNTCDANHSLESIFGDNEIYKFTNGSWAYWKKDLNAHNNPNNMDILQSIDNKEGFMIKSTSSIQSTIEIPYDILEPLENDLFTFYKTGWYLISSSTDNSVNKISQMVQKQNKSLKYILRINNGAWNIYAPKDNDKVDANIPRTSNVKKDEAFWIYIE